MKSSEKKINVMLLAAGKGERLRPYTETTPKPLIPFLGVPMVEYALSHLAKFCENTGVQIQNLVVNTHHLPDQIENYFRKERSQREPPFWDHLEISYEPKLLGGGGIKKCENFLNLTENFLVINADEVHFQKVPGSVSEMWKSHQANDSLATLLCMEHAEVGIKLGGVWVDDNFRVQGFGKGSPSPAQHSVHGLHFLGFVFLRRDIFKYFQASYGEENLLYDVLTKAISEKETAMVYRTEAEWFETGKVSDFLDASRELVKNPPATLISFLNQNQIFLKNWKPEVEAQAPELAHEIEIFLKSITNKN